MKSILYLSVFIILTSCKSPDIEGAYILNPCEFNYDSLYLKDGEYRHIIRQKSDGKLVYSNKDKYVIKNDRITLYNFYLNDVDRVYASNSNFELSKFSSVQLIISEMGDTKILTANIDLGIAYRKKW